MVFFKEALKDTVVNSDSSLEALRVSYFFEKITLKVMVVDKEQILKSTHVTTFFSSVNLLVLNQNPVMSSKPTSYK